MTIEVRSLVGPENIDATDEGILFGLAIPFNRATNIGDPKFGGFEERIAPGACTKSLREGDIVALWNHNSAQPLGRTSAGNLTLKTSTRGVEPELKPVDTSYSRDLTELVKGGVVRGWSFGFEVIKDDWTDDNDEPADQWTGTKRCIREMKLIEVSPVTFPAYDTTEIASRSAILEAREERAKSFTEGAVPDAEARGGKKPYGDVKYADPKNNKYPVNTKRRVKAAWAYINKAKNAAVYPLNGVTLASVKAAIKSAAKKFGVMISEENAVELATEWRCYLKDYDVDLVLDEQRDDDDEPYEDRKLKNSVAKRLAQIDVILDQALKSLKECDLDKLPDGAQRAASLISSAAEHSSHIMHDQKLSPSDGVIGKDNRDDEDEDTSADTEQRGNQPKPDGESTSAEILSDDALRLASMEAMSRAVKLDL